ncbi:MAG: DEAD/DEAH box helicase [Acidiferrobacteraceae bacterium]|jgi:ATP-dependent RNA helicase RhlB|nr:DEAD/DEAH box helicase [Acidiferrobacteraceae bacterium]
MEDTSYLTKTRFTEFALEPQLLEGLADAGFEYCTKIQAESLPVALAGRDVAGQAQTGTGKTAAFLLAIFNHLLTHPRPESAGPLSTRAVVLAPTRELAIQIHRDAQVLGRATGLKLGLVYGGTGYQEQRETLAGGVDVLIGTPGRLIDYFKQQVFDLNAVQVLVLDEADRMFDLGFIKDIRYVLRRMPPPTERLNLLFSATLSHRVNELGYEHMNNPEEIKIDADVIVAERLLEEVYYPANAEKLPLLLGLMRQTAGDRVLVFSNMRVTCDRVGRALKQQGYTAAVLSGDVPQQKREQLLNAFKEGKRQVLVATDVAARGLHIPSVSHVINYDLPQDAEDYVHRIGRTARAGASGHAISFACEDHAFSLLDIEQYIGHPLVRQEISEAVLERPVARSQTNSDKPRKSPAHERTPKRDEKASARPPRRERTSQSNRNTTDEPRSEAKPATAAAAAPAAPAPIPVAAKPEVVRRVQSSRHRPKVEVPAVG